MGRAPCCDKASVKKGPWSPEEDAKLKAYIDQNGTGGNWIALPQKIGLKRCGKSCRLRWLNYLRPNIKHGGFSQEEDNIICSLYINIGSRWSIIAAQLPGRTDNDIKNYWNTKLKKKLLGKQRKADQATARRGGAAVKREPNTKTLDEINNANYSNQLTPPYWPDLTAVLAPPPPPPSLNYHDQESLRNTLVKLGGRFSDDHPNLQLYPLENFPPFGQTQFIQNAYLQNPLENFLPLDQNHQISDQELIFGNDDQQQYGAFSGFYGSEILDGSSGSSSVESSNNITCCSLGNYNDNNNYPHHQVVPQVSSFDDSSFLAPEL